ETVYARTLCTRGPQRARLIIRHQSCSGSGVLMADSTIPQTASARTPATRLSRRLPIGAEPIGGGRTHFRVWAPAAARVAVALVGGATTDLSPEDNGYFRGVADATAGA